MSQLCNHVRKLNSRILESSVQSDSSFLSSREDIIMWVIEEEVNIVKDRFRIFFVCPLMRDYDGVRGRIKGHEDCKTPLSVECPSRRRLGERDTYIVGLPRYHPPR